MNKLLVIVDDKDFNGLMIRMQNEAMNIVAQGLHRSLKDTVDVAKANAMRVLKMHSGKLVNSLNVLQVRIGTDKVEIDIGSDMDGYPFYQENGFFSVFAGRRIPAKNYFSSAVWSTRDKVNDDVISFVASKYGGS